MPTVTLNADPNRLTPEYISLLRPVLKEAVSDVLNDINQEHRPYETTDILVKTEWRTEDDDPDMKDLQIEINVHAYPSFLECGEDIVAQRIYGCIQYMIPEKCRTMFVQILFSTVGFASASND